jgi:hypothetical protein
LAPGKSDCGDPCNNPPVGARWIAGEELSATAGAARADATALRVEMSLPTAAAKPEKDPDHGLGLDHRDRIQNRGEASAQPDENQPIDVPQPHPRRGLAA